MALALLGVLSGAAACSSGNGSGTGGTGVGGTGVGGAGVVSDLIFKTCPDSTAVGGFSITLVSPTAGAQVLGSVKDSVAPSDVSTVLVQQGTCRIVLGPDLVCGTMCVNGMVCAGNNACVPSPRAVSVGAVQGTGLASAVSLPAATSYYSPLSTYPPYTVGNSLALTATGGAYAPLALAVRAVAPLVVPEQVLMLAADQPLTVAWTPAPEPGAGNIEVTLDIAHHGGIAAKLTCDWPDSGMGTIPGALITQLIARGTAGFPVITVTRESVDSAAIAAGCVEFKTVSSVELPLMVEGVTSCNAQATPPLLCPTGTCGTYMKCH